MLTEQLTNQLIAAATSKAGELGIAVCIAVVDDGAILSGFKRMDGAFKGSVEVAVSKARTSALFPFSSAMFGEVIRNHNLTGMELTNGGMCCFAGGLPVQIDGRTFGAIGISGGSAEQDEAIASHAAAAVITGSV